MIICCFTDARCGVHYIGPISNIGCWVYKYNYWFTWYLTWWINFFTDSLNSIEYCSGHTCCRIFIIGEICDCGSGIQEYDGSNTNFFSGWVCLSADCVIGVIGYCDSTWYWIKSFSDVSDVCKFNCDSIIFSHLCGIDEYLIRITHISTSQAIIDTFSYEGIKSCSLKFSFGIFYYCGISDGKSIIYREDRWFTISRFRSLIILTVCCVVVECCCISQSCTFLIYFDSSIGNKFSWVDEWYILYACF